jgi:hypothetical protein
MDARRVRWIASGTLISLALVACGAESPSRAPTYGSSHDDDGPRAAATAAPAPQPPGMEQAGPQKEARQGLGTEFGEKVLSRMTNVPFERAEAQRPFAIGAIHYNDATGVAAQIGNGAKTSISAVSLSSGAVTVQLKDDRGVFYGGFRSGERTFMVGEVGKRYSIVLRNMTNSRIETVVSVDGNDVINGRAANFSNRGYLLDPRAEVEIEGFRTSTDAVAAFRFGAVKDSYAEKKFGDAKNVGVIGIALFHEKGSGIPTLSVVEPAKRNDSQFATPP